MDLHRSESFITEKGRRNRPERRIMPLPPAPSELGAKLATTRTKASAREDAPRSETLEELRERIRARNPRPVEPAAAAPAEKAPAPAPTK